MRQSNSLAGKQHNRDRGMTLIELITAICIFALIAIGFSDIHTFSQYQVLFADRKAKLQNDASYVLEHIAKNMTGTSTQGGAVGDINNKPISSINIGGDNSLLINIDYNNNGKWDGTAGGDRQIAYRFSATNYQISYCSDYSNLSTCAPITSKIIRGDFTPTGTDTYCKYCKSNSGVDYTNCVEVQIRACWDPSKTNCGSSTDNPGFTLKNRICMPSASIN